ncbi:MAG: hypothetical protein IJP69_11645 [Synergistaceae bacterium]|nr:hypothetical protein [Synergistaceae bacterium]
MANINSWRKVPAKKVLDYADQVGDEQAAKEFCINVNKIKGLRENHYETVTINGYTQPEKLKILARADEVGDELTSDEFKVSQTTINKWRKKLQRLDAAKKSKAELQDILEAIPETQNTAVQSNPEPVVEATAETEPEIKTTAEAAIVKPENVAKLDALTETFEGEYANLDLRQKLIIENKILAEKLEMANRQLNAMKSAIRSLL